MLMQSMVTRMLQAMPAGWDSGVSLRWRFLAVLPCVKFECNFANSIFYYIYKYK